MQDDALISEDVERHAQEEEEQQFIVSETLKMSIIVPLQSIVRIDTSLTLLSPHTDTSCQCVSICPF